MSIKLGIADHKKGTTWDGLEIVATTIDENNNIVPLDLTGASVVANFKSGNNTIFSFKTSDNSIIIPNPTNGKMNFAPRVMNVPPNNYYFDVIVTLENGDIEPIVDTHSWNIYL